MSGRVSVYLRHLSATNTVSFIASWTYREVGSKPGGSLDTTMARMVPLNIFARDGVLGIATQSQRRKSRSIISPKKFLTYVDPL